MTGDSRKHQGAPSDKQVMAKLAEVYREKGLESEFAMERELLQALLDPLRRSLKDSGLVLETPYKVGSTATVWLVWDRGLERRRVLKLARPKFSKIDEVVAVVRVEGRRLSDLSHQNLTRIYHVGEVPLKKKGYSFPYFVMEYLDGVSDFDEYIVSAVKRGQQGEQLIQFFRDALLGISHLHENEVVHCDIKPGNLLIAHNAPAMVADLGYSKKLFPRLGESRDLTAVMTTPEYAHPDLKRQLRSVSDPNASKAEIPRNELRYAFDLYAFGRTILKVLDRISEVEAQDSLHAPALTPYQRQYLTVISRRLLDGQVERSDDSLFGLPQYAMEDLKYRTAAEALDDVEKLLNLYDLETLVPELNPNGSGYIQVPHSRVPLTARVQAIIDHPYVARLAQATQLGFVSMVYPGAQHSRLEHALGVFAGACEYVRALWYDEANCFFRSIMDERQLRLGLLAALLHDIGQYPMAHDLTEVSSMFNHETFTQAVVEAIPGGDMPSLGQVISDQWGGVEYEQVLRILELPGDASIREQILHSLISGPLDCDKLDYLRRDSTHLGVTFGLAIDHERLRRHLTVVCRKEEIRASDGTARETRVVAHIGILWKALPVALGVRRARREMFQQVYWHHTVRALKAMLGWATRRMLILCRTGGTEGELWRAFSDFLLTYQFDRIVPAPLVPPEIPAPGDLLLASDAQDPWSFPTGLSQSDDSALRLLASFSDGAVTRMLLRIRRREFYKRTVVLSADRWPGQFSALYERFRTYRLDEKHEEIENLRSTWEHAILEEVASKHGVIAKACAERYGPDSDPDAVLEPLVLVDVPVKALSRVDRGTGLWFLPEDTAGIHSRVGSLPEFTASESPADESSFDREVGKIRVFVRPDVGMPLAALDERRIVEILCG